MVGVESPTDAPPRNAPPHGCTELAVAASTWVVFTSRRALPGAIQDMWKRIYSEWFPTCGYEHAGGPDLDVRPEGETSLPDCYCEVWLPVRKA